MDLSDALLLVCLAAALVAAFLTAAALGFLVLAVEAGLLSLAAGGLKISDLELPKVRIPWRS